MRHMEITHPNFSARDNINVYLTSSESLDYLNKSSHEQTPVEQSIEGEKATDSASCPEEVEAQVESPMQLTV